MKIILFTFLVCILSVQLSNAQSGWVIIPSGTTQTLNAIHFMNANTGLIVGNNGMILRTINGGLTWSIIPPPPPGIQSFFDIYFTISLDAFMVDDRGGIYKSSNVGLNWIQQNSMTAAPLNGVFFADGNTGVVCGGNSTIRYTLNAGLNWLTPPPPPHGGTFTAEFIVQPLFYFGNSTGQIQITPNYGSNWVVPYQGPARIDDIEFVNPSTGFACGGFTIVKSSNAGSNWTPTIIPIEIVALSLVSTNPITVYGGGTTGRVIKSTDAGNTFTVQQTPVTDNFFDILFPFNALNGYAVGSNGRIVMTTTGGITFVIQISSEVPERFSLSQNYPNPFNPKTIINFQLPIFNYVKLIVYDVLGREVAVLVNEELKAGTYEIEWDASNYLGIHSFGASGVYYYRIVAEGFIDTKKMVLIK